MTPDLGTNDPRRPVFLVKWECARCFRGGSITVVDEGDPKAAVGPLARADHDRQITTARDACPFPSLTWSILGRGRRG